MPLLGKLLLFVNVMVAAGLIFLATQDWAKRQEINAAVVRHRLALAGFPTDRPAGTADAGSGSDEADVPFRFETSGGFVTETVNPALLKKYLEGANGGSGELGPADKLVTTLAEEVRRVKEKAAAALAPLDDKAKLAKLCGEKVPAAGDGPPGFRPGWLFTLADGYEERDFVRRLADPADVAVAKENAKTANDLFEKKFATVLAAPNPKLAAEYAERIKAATEKFRGVGTAWQATAKAWLEKAEAVRKAAEDKAPDADLKAEETAALQAETRAHAQLSAADKEFAAVLTDRTPTAAQDDGDRRRRIAHLLAHLDLSADWQKRVALLVGLREYQATLAAQVPRMQDMARATERGIESDQAGFVAEYEQLKQSALTVDRLLADQVRIKLGNQQQSAEEDALVARRTTFLNSRKTYLTKIRGDVDAMLKAQADVEGRLFAVQKQVGETLAKNFELEDRLEAAEARRPGRGDGGAAPPKAPARPGGSEPR